MSMRDKAQNRVNEWNKLKAHEETIMYDWPEGDELDRVSDDLRTIQGAVFIAHKLLREERGS